ncbi:hypothetical protein F6V25_07780 [Oryzomonas japonica]|uniref:SmpA / OmlA family protein n=1 Tax=Oryzomonas japonica TaxID=2603858 RepID=A0A7J4ZR73_9BACT|nr:hypothetical protein [Oryzomonas japonica]KAB0665613.1 hypothetical protein F6V25_07780 [Oryzomonas japonica]
MIRLLLGTMLIAIVLLLMYRPVFPTKHLGPAAAAAIRKGTTNKAQVRALLGEPQSAERQVPLRQVPGTEPLPAKYTASEIWTYWTVSRHKSSNAAPGTGPAHFFIIVFFDARGMVLDCDTKQDE